MLVTLLLNYLTAITRFDGRSLLDSVPEPVQGLKEDNEDTDELNFERYRDLIEAERLNSKMGKKNDLKLLFLTFFFLSQ